MSKRKRVFLSIEDKIKIIEALKKGVSGRKLALQWGIGSSTISDIKKNADTILKYTCKIDSEDARSRRKSIKKPKNELLDDALYCWYIQKRSSGEPISGPLLCQKALELNVKLGGDESFGASNGWLYRFKLRHGIRENDMHGIKITDVEAENSFTDELKRRLEEHEYDLDLIYNLDKTGFDWKSLPSKLATNKEPINVFVCANATGTHRLPLLLMGKIKQPTCLMEIPLMYKNEKSLWMNIDIFIDWYENTFIPKVKKFQMKIGKHGKVLLLLDHLPTHLAVELLDRDNGMFSVKFLPPNVLNPIVTKTLKHSYKKQLLLRLLTMNDDNEDDDYSCLKQLELKEHCGMLVIAWDSIERTIFQKTWNKILKVEVENSANQMDDLFREEINDIVNKSGRRRLNIEDIQEWFNRDNNNPDFSIMSDEEIIANLMEPKESVKVEMNSEEDDEISENSLEEPVKMEIIDEELQFDAEDVEGPSHAEAFEAFEIGLKWFEKQTECDNVGLLQLKRLRDLAVLKMNEKE